MPPLNNFTRSCLAIAISQAVAAPALAASIVVNDNGDPGTGDTCTLRQAIVSANTNDADAYPSNCTEGSNNATDTITFANSGPITLTRPLPSLNTNMAIIGNTNGSTIDGNGTGRVFHVRNAAVSFIDLTISGGSTSHRTDGPSARKGGGIYANDSTLSLSNSTVSGNSADDGGGIYTNDSTVSLSNSTVSGNSANDGGGIYTNDSTVSLSNSTISGNSAGNNGGAIYIGGYSSLSLSNSTVSSNSAVANGGAIYILRSSYYYYYSASSLRQSNKTRSGNSAAANGYTEYYNSYITVSLNNNIISGNRAASEDGVHEIAGGNTTFTTAHNLFGDSVNGNFDAFSGFTPDATDITATRNGSQPTYLSAILAPLADNGGSTQTHALVAGSPAIDSGDDELCAAEPVNSLDQRGALRPVGNACDIGAFEKQEVQGNIVVNDNGDMGSASTCTLRQAIISANTNNAGASNCAVGNETTDTITFANSGTITLTSWLPALTTDMVITGRANGSTIDANSSGRVFYISGAGAAVSINNLTISGGSLSSGSGGGIYASRNASVSLSNSTVSGNWGGRSGGAISINNTSTLSMSNSTVSGNSATSSGGAIFIANYSTLSLSNSTVSGNSARTGGAIRLAATSTLSLSNSTVSDNSADYYGGISASVGNNTVSLNNNIFSGNRGSVCAEICASNTIFTTAHNLFGDSVNYNSDAFSGFTPDTTDITATSNGSQPTALSRILAPLANNGGGTQTHALVAGSPAIDSGNNALCAAEPINNLDQRGAPRPVGNACDIGAYEGMGVSSRTKADSSMAKDDSSFFVVPLPNGKVVVFEL